MSGPINMDSGYVPVIPSPVPRPQQAQDRFDRQIDKIDSPPAAPGKIGSFQYPFQIQIIDPATINVRYATVQDVIPTNIATDLNPADNATTIYYIEVEVDIDGVVIGVTLDSASSLPPDTDYFGYITIGQVTMVSGAITVVDQAATHSLRTAMCGRVVEGGVLIKAGLFEFWGF